MKKKVWYYEEWVGRHASFRPRRSVKINFNFFSGAGSGSSHGGGHGSDEGTIWLCKICGEQREMWKKSGAWFFKVSFLCTY